MHFNLKFLRDPANVDCNGVASIAEIHPSWQYATATLMIFVASFEDKDDDEIASVLLHELGHYLLHPISKYGSSPEYDLLEERVCTDYARSVQTAMEASGQEVADHYKLEIKRLEKQLKQLMKQLEEKTA